MGKAGSLLMPLTFYTLDANNHAGFHMKMIFLIQTNYLTETRRNTQTRCGLRGLSTVE